MAKQAVTAHLRTCVVAHAPATGVRVPLFHLHIEGKDQGFYWLDLEIKGASKLRQLDQYLRQVWLECCGHLSAFEIGRMIYTVSLDREWGIAPKERAMNVALSEVLLSPGQRFSYQYDFGSTTELVFRVVGKRDGYIGRSPVRLLARNEAPTWLCAVCKAPANHVCPYCLDEGEPFCCREHIAAHSCGEPEAFLPVVNSPRMGVCGYSGEV
jgi:hypothetical protein